MIAAEPSVRCQEALARQVARLRGRSSAAAQTLKQLEAARAARQDHVMYSQRNRWLVGSPESILAATEAAQTKTRQAFKRG